MSYAINLPPSADVSCGVDSIISTSSGTNFKIPTTITASRTKYDDSSRWALTIEICEHGGLANPTRASLAVAKDVPGDEPTDITDSKSVAITHCGK